MLRMVKVLLVLVISYFRIGTTSTTPLYNRKWPRGRRLLFF